MGSVVVDSEGSEMREERKGKKRGGWAAVSWEEGEMSERNE